MMFVAAPYWAAWLWWIIFAMHEHWQQAMGTKNLIRRGNFLYWSVPLVDIKKACTRAYPAASGSGGSPGLATDADAA